eukprot:CAMPEP_0185791896 /NCGR_PEP_ID=MMETSP1174-20130828/158631_1 /TAXON_ID=35687 /ORGANISM="Dictyocha speculum, Strain CCMP1381" /LENGTH=641 /DNA_ID=CAMNT_0028486905 /DNA_START=199 /DNA_END=2124 /DNA_ORIENTATION=+
MVAFSVLFENLREKLEEATSASLQPVIRSLFAELTLLGFIGLSLFLLDKLEAVHMLSEDLFGEEDTIGETSESVHMALFLVMVIFLGTVLELIRIGTNVSFRWQRWEENILDQELIYDNLRTLTKKPASLANFQYGEHDEFQMLIYSALRRDFISHANIDPHFNFSEYLTVLLGKVLAEIVEVPAGTWLGLWIFMSVAWICNMIFDKEILAVFIIILGWLIPIKTRLIHGKLLSIKFDLVDHAELEKPFDHADVEMEETRHKFTEADKLLRSQNAVQAGGQLKGNVLKAFFNYFNSDSYEPIRLIARYGTKSPYDHETHHHRWWDGENKEPKEAALFTLDLMRYCLLSNSIYVAVCLLVFFPSIMKAAATEEISLHLAYAIIFFGCIPPVMTWTSAPRTVQAYVITSTLANMRNDRVVEQGVRRMKTRSAFLALKVIYMMASGSHKKEAQRNSIESRPEEKESEQSVTQTLKQKKVWHEIFKIMDEDDSDSLSKEELETLMKKVLGDNITDAQIEDIISALDKDGDNDISFEEFFKYVNGISSMIDEQAEAEKISDAIFDMIDKPDPDAEQVLDAHGHAEEDEISIKELQDICNDFKQELSPDDVFQVIKDIDEDGNGKLNKEEFFELLQRLDIVPTEKHE